MKLRRIPSGLAGAGLYVLALVAAYVVATSAAKADSKISALPAALAITGTELVPVVQGGVTSQSTPSAINTYVGKNVAASCNSAGNYLQFTSGTGFACLAPMTPLHVTPANPGTTASSALLSGGIGAVTSTGFTPNATGRVLITVSGDTNCSSSDIVKTQIYYGTGAPPAAGAAETGTALGSNVQTKSTTAAFPIPFTLTYIVTGLTLGTTYWVDLGVANTAGGTLTLQDLMVTAVEF